jgi:phosphopantothenoylcysteine decarboxylase/phosphopantothenate--cysteine ligase
VADFRPAVPLAGKLKKEDLPEGAGLELALVRNPDILAEIARERGDRIVVGFAAESQDLIAAARRKLARKGCDLLVANDVSRSDAGFESDQNAVALLTPDGDVQELPLLDKREVAARIWDRIEKLLGARRA